MNPIVLSMLQFAGAAVDSAATTTQRCWVAKCAIPNPTVASAIVFWLFLAWMIGVILYFWWAIRHYNLNWGLSPQEWKVLHPEIYCEDQKEIDQYLQRRASLERRTGKPMAEPQNNPYEKDSFGLPPGTVRGTLALTALVGFVLVQSLSMVSPDSLDGHFEQINTVFKMVMAFYFGSRALEVMEKSRKGDTSPMNQNSNFDANAAVVVRCPAFPPVVPPPMELPPDVVEDGQGMPPPPPPNKGPKHS
ncbi:MAG TPA: hypothetical protein PKO15_02450 [Fibrobacteria bacterium]|nr:hypothetical protein [Fibrobacteria bacterium]